MGKIDLDKKQTTVNQSRYIQGKLTQKWEKLTQIWASLHIIWDKLIEIWANGAEFGQFDQDKVKIDEHLEVRQLDQLRHFDTSNLEQIHHGKT